MMEKCFDIGTIQAFLDGELSLEAVNKITHHIAICDSCAMLLAEAEEESAVAFSALEQEFNTLVPTHRLWTKINDSIEKEEKPFWKTVSAYIANLKSQISIQTITAFASLLIVVGLFMAFLSLRDNNSPSVAENTSGKQSEAPLISNPETASNVESPNSAVQSEQVNVKFEPSENQLRATNANFVRKANSERSTGTNVRNPKFENRKDFSESHARATNENIAGEESYIKTIATLTETVNNRKDEVLKPSAQVAFEKDLAVVDDAIAKMRVEVKKNPKNEGAKQVLLASYQNKIDLLNSVAEKNELMATLR